MPGLLLAFGAGFVVRRKAGDWGLLDRPGGHKAHEVPTPLGGGLAIWLGVVGPFALGQILLWSMAADGAGQGGGAIGAAIELVRTHRGGLLARAPQLWFLLGGGTVLLVLGLIDDRRGLDWKIRLAVQTLVAVAAVYGYGWRLTALVDLPIVTGLVSVGWIVLLINSFNMLDNMDGLSAGVAAVAAGVLAAVLLLAPNPEGGGPQLFVAGFLLVLLGSLLGFLWHNRPPARLFMGDAGSYFVGFSIAAATLLATFAGNHGAPRHTILAPLFVLAVPLYDTASVLWIRLRSGRSPVEGDLSHFSHRLVELGLSRPRAVATIYLVSVTCGLGALLLHRIDAAGAWIVAVMIGCILALVAVLETAARRKIRS